MKQDYYIAAMKYRYLHKTDLTAFVLSLGFKGADVKIEIDKTYYEEDDGRLYIQPMIRTEQNDIILEFQKVVAQIFEELLLENSNTLKCCTPSGTLARMVIAQACGSKL